MTAPARKYLGETVEVKAAHRIDEARLAQFMGDQVEGYEGPLSVRQFEGGQSNPSRLVMTTGDFAVYSQNTWQIRSNLTLNYGLRWETYFPVALQDKDNWQPHLSSAQLNAQAVAQVANTQAGGRLYSRNFGNFGPRLGLAWAGLEPARLIGSSA